MNWIKNITFIALLNFVTIIVIVVTASYLESMKVSDTPEIAPISTPSATPATVEETTPTNVPIQTTPAPSFFPAKTNIPNNSATSTTLNPSSVPTETLQSGPCIITLDGSSYDITTFQNIHGGGNVFTCGSDQSQLFHDQHPDSFLDKLAKYKT